MMINIAICDDERIFLEQLEKTIRFVAKKLRLVVMVTQYSHGLELLKHQKKHQLFFLILICQMSQVSISLKNL